MEIFVIRLIQDHAKHYLDGIK